MKFHDFLKKKSFMMKYITCELHKKDKFNILKTVRVALTLMCIIITLYARVVYIHRDIRVFDHHVGSTPSVPK